MQHVPHHENKSWSILMCTYGRALVQLKSYEEAIKAFEKSLQMYSSAWNTHLFLANTYLSLKNFKQARDHYEEALKFAPQRDKKKVSEAMKGLPHS